MNKIILEVIQSYDESNNSSRISIENFSIVSLYTFLRYSPNIHLQFSKKNSPILAGNVNDSNIKIKSKFSTFSRTNLRKDKSIKSLYSPIFVNDYIYTSGLCAVARKITLHSIHQQKENLLGFKSSCLQAPTETSLWTRFCEIEIITAVYTILKHKFINNEEFLVPSVFRKFENHLNQPVRMHNIFKITRETTENKNNELLPHKFAEGIYFTLADILLYINFNFLFEYLPNSIKLYLKLPLLTEWLNTITIHSPLLNNNIKEMILLCEKIDYNNNNFNITYNINEEEQLSLYKSDPKRYKPKSRIFTIQDNIYENIEKFKKLNINNSKNDIITKRNFEWSNISEKAHLEYGNLPQKRLYRKKQQIKYMIDVIYSIAKDNDIIVDFCSGTGHLGLILACLLPKCTIIFLENKPFSIDKTQQRAINMLNLNNCIFYQSNIDYFIGNFDIGISLHACGTATDIVIKKCILKNATFICCPCCYGSINPMPHIIYPLSNSYKIGLTEIEYLYLAHAADQTQITDNYNFNLSKNLQGEFCMDIIDTDRKYYANEYKYNVILTTLKPENCTLKNRLLIGSLRHFTDEIQIINTQES